MYSITFAMIVIVGIAVTNLLLGFATALLMGRGPKCWSDVDRSLVLEPIPLRAPLPATDLREDCGEPAELSFTMRPLPESPEPDLAETCPASEEVKTPEPVQTASADSPAATTPSTTGAAAAFSREQPTAIVPAKLKLPLKNAFDEQEAASPEITLDNQLATWRQSELADEVPSLSGIRFEVRDASLHEAARESLSQVIHTSIRAQVRKDRKLLRIASNQYAWFSCDVPPEDALLPVERIRQMLAATHLHHQGEPVAIDIVAGVVAGLPDDTAAVLLQRLQAAYQHAISVQKHATSLDTGQGPEGIEAYDIEVVESECEF